MPYSSCADPDPVLWVAFQFLAPIGAQWMLMSVCMSVCAALTCLEQSIFKFLGQRSLKEQSEQSESNKSINIRAYNNALQ